MSTYKGYDSSKLTVLIHRYLKMEQALRENLMHRITEHYIPDLAMEVDISDTLYTIQANHVVVEKVVSALLSGETSVKLDLLELNNEMESLYLRVHRFHIEEMNEQEKEEFLSVLSAKGKNVAFFAKRNRFVTELFEERFFPNFGRWEDALLKLQQEYDVPVDFLFLVEGIDEMILSEMYTRQEFIEHCLKTYALDEAQFAPLFESMINSSLPKDLNEADMLKLLADKKEDIERLNMTMQEELKLFFKSYIHSEANRIFGLSITL